MKTFKKIGLMGAVAFALFAFNACGDDSSTSGSSDGGNRGGIPDTVETFMELSDYDCGKSQKCVATYLTEYHDMAVCDGNNDWVIGTLIEKMDCIFSSSSAKSSDSKSNDPAEVTDDSSDSKDNPSSAGTSTKSSASEEPDSSDSKGNPSSAGTSTKSSNSNTSGNDAKSSSSSAGKVNGLATPCKTETEDNCEYGELVDERDGQTYKTIQIGTQTWMAENLNYDPGQGGSGSSAYDWSWCYDDNPSNCAKYGRLYTWAAAMDSATTYCGFGKSCTATHPVQGICPSGWHLPDTTDWHDLIVAAGGQYYAGAKLKSTSGWENDGWGNDGNGTDAFGFSALPSGYRSRGGDYHTAGGYAYIWSSFEYITGLVAYEMGLRCDIAYAYIERGNEESGYAVRCLKDSD